MPLRDKVSPFRSRDCSFQNNMKKSKAPSKSAVAQPKAEIIRPFPPMSLVSSPVPFNSKECYLVCEWEAHDGTWENLLVNHRKDVFFLDSCLAAEATSITTSQALYWYATKRALDCDFGMLGWPNLDELLMRAVREIKYAEEVIGKRRFKSADDGEKGGAR